MKLEFRIALRYLFAKKSHNVINVISAVSSAGLAIGSAALVLILSVYNGFNEIVDRNLSDLDADLVLRRSSGEPFNVSELEDVFGGMQEDGRIRSLSSELSFQVFVRYGQEQAVAKLRGVDSVFPEQRRISSHIVSGKFSLWSGELPMACTGAGLAHELGLSPFFVQPLELYYPERGKAVSVMSPGSSLRKEKMYPGSILSVSEDIDREVIIADISIAQKLYDSTLVSSVGIDLRDTRELKAVLRDYPLPEGFEMADRYRQHEDIYKMMRVEKFAVFLIMVFIVLIVALNISGSLSMLKMEKAGDMETLRALGASEKMRRRIFIYEGWLISLSGILVGLIAGLALSLLQQKFGFVKIPGNFLCDAYPVCVKPLDVLLGGAALCLVGLGASLLTNNEYEN